MNNVNNLITTMLEKPGLWMRPEFQTLRNFVDVVSSSTATFSKNTRASSIIHENADDVLLSNKFSQQVESGSMFKRDDIDYDHVLQITDASTKFRKFTLNSSQHT